MIRKPTNEEINERILKSGVDALTNDIYINATTPMEFYCSKGHTWKAKLGNVTHNHQGCPYCCGRYFIVGESDLYTVHPEIAQLLLNPEEGRSMSKCSGVKAKFKCPICGAISEHIVSNVVKRGFSCPVCSDGISYPNKFIASMMMQLGVQYIPEFSFDGANYRYDCYLPEQNIIIEMHGRQHYEKWGRSNRSLEDEQKNDQKKMDFAISKNISYYIIIDSKCSDINYISKRILQSELNKIFDLSSIDWRQCGYYASGTLIHNVAKLYNAEYTVNDIAKDMKYSSSTIRKWLKQATKIGLCNYVPSKGFLMDKHKIILLNTKEIFDSITSASKKYGVPIANISKVCLYERSYAGIDFETGMPYVWRYLENYDSNEIIDFKSLVDPRAHYSDNTKLIKEVS